MAPTVEEVAAKLDEIVARDAGVVWSRPALVRAVFRGLKTTSPCAEDRLDTLELQGRLVTIALFPQGYIRPPEESKGMSSGSHPVYFHPRGGDSLDRGTLSYERRKDFGALWAGDKGRYYYTTASGWDGIRSALAAELERRTQEQAKKQQESRRELNAALDKLAPDAKDLILQLDDALGNRGDAHAIWSRGKVALSVSTLDDASAEALLDIIRRGLKNTDK